MLCFLLCRIKKCFALPHLLTCLLLCEHLDVLLAEKNFSLDLYAFLILRNLLTFSSFLVQVVFKSFFFIIWPQVFLKHSLRWFLVSTSCFNEVILAEIVISGSQVMTKFDQIFFYLLSTDLISLFFCFMVWFRKNHKLVEASFF